LKQPTRLWNKNYLLLWQGQFVSKFGDQFFSMALMLWLSYEIDSATLMGTLLMLGGIASLVFGPFAGTVADRASRKLLIVVTDLLNGLFVTSLAVMFFIRPNNTDLLIIVLFCVTIINAVLRAFFSPAIGAAIPDLVPKTKLNAANSMGQFSTRIAQLIGTPVASSLYMIIGAPMLFLLNGLSYIFSGLSELFITIPRTKRMPEPPDTSKADSFKKDLREGFNYVLKNKGLRAIVLVSAGLSFFSMPIITLMPFFVKDFLHAKAGWVGIISAVYGVGAMIGFSLAAVLHLDKRTRAKLIMAIIIFQGVLYGILAGQRLPLQALFFVLILGIGDGYINVNIMTIIQITTPSEIRGRVFGVLAMLSGSLAPLAMGASGVLADLLNHNIPAIYLACGVSMVLIAISALAMRDYREFLVYDEKQMSAEPESGEKNSQNKSADDDKNSIVGN